MKDELRITVIYLIFGTLWILFSDQILFIIVDDIALLNRLQNLKGFFYVLITAGLFYLLIHRALEALRENRAELKEKYQEIEAYAEELDALNEELEDSYKKETKLNSDLEQMIELVTNVTGKKMDDEQDYLTYLFNIITNLIPDLESALLFIPRGSEMQIIDSLGYNEQKLKEFNLKQDKIDLPQNKLIRSDQLKRLMLAKDENQQLKEKLKNETIAFNISFKDNQVAIINLDFVTGKEFAFKDKKLLTALINITTAFFKIKDYNQLELNLQKEVIISFIKMLEIYDKYTKGHSQEVAKLSAKIAKRLNLNQELVDKTYWAGLVHDIGKIAVSREILNKPGRLTDQEYEEIKKHPHYGSLILAESDRLKDISDYILYHHERWDGYGYPEGLKEDKIPLIARIITVTDAWNAMTTDRAYRKGLSKAEAIKELKDNKGKQFAPKIVDTFLAIVD